MDSDKESVDGVLSQFEIIEELGKDYCEEATGSRRLQTLKQIFIDTILEMCIAFQYPENLKDRELFRDLRKEFATVSRMEALELGGGYAALNFLYRQLQKVEENNWRKTEAILYSMCAISTTIDDTLESDVWSEVVEKLPGLPKNHPELLETVCSAIGAFSGRIGRRLNGDPILLDLIRILENGLCGSEDSVSAAAIAFRRLCQECPSSLLPYLDTISSVFEAAVDSKSGRVSFENSLELSCAYCHVLNELNFEDPTEHHTFQKYFSTSNALTYTRAPCPPSDLSVRLKRWTCIFRYVHRGEAWAADKFHNMGPQLKEIMVDYAWQPNIADSLFELCYQALSQSGKILGLKFILTFLACCFDAYMVNHTPCILLVVQLCLEKFQDMKVYESAERFFRHTEHLFTDSKEFFAIPKMAGCLFTLAHTCLRFYQAPFLSSRTFENIVRCSITGSMHRHRMALTFLDEVMKLGDNADEQNLLRRRNAVIVDHGSKLTRLLVASITAAGPSDTSNLETMILVALARDFPFDALRWVEEVADLISKSDIAEAYKKIILGFHDTFKECSANQNFKDLEEKINKHLCNLNDDQINAVLISDDDSKI